MSGRFRLAEQAGLAVSLLASLVSAGTVGAEITGSYGKLTLNANGTYSYNPNENINSASLP